MPKINLSGMTVEALMDLRNRVDEMLLGHRAELQKQLDASKCAEQPADCVTRSAEEILSFNMCDALALHTLWERMHVITEGAAERSGRMGRMLGLS